MWTDDSGRLGLKREAERHAAFVTQTRFGRGWLSKSSVAAPAQTLLYGWNFINTVTTTPTNSAVGLSVGATARADLSGPVTAIGLLGQQNGAVATVRFDSFAIVVGGFLQSYDTII